MIKVEYKDVDNLKKAYVKLFKIGMLQNGLDCAVGFYPDLNRIVSRFTDVKQMLVADFDVLTDLYFDYQGLRSSMDATAFNDMDVFLSSVFNYKTRQSRIAKFFMEDKNGFEIHTCHYCDMAYINVFAKDEDGELMNHFDLDHVLDKAKCPLVALSLFNFVPSCQVCNEKLKHSTLIGSETNPAEVKKLSPTSKNYDFKNNVLIGVDPFPAAGDDYMANPDKYTIKFTPIGDKAYMKVEELFHLRERYGYHKMEALRLLQLKHDYEDSHIRDIADLLGRTFEDVKEDIFGEDFTKKNHRCFSKLKSDILK